jgi:hypothetical protein
MPTRICSFLTGLVYLFFGICGFIPSLVDLPPARLRFFDMHIVGHWGFLFAWLPVNPVHNVVYIALGAAGLLAAPFFTTAKLCCQATFAVTLMFAVVGLLPLGASEVWGLLPLFSWNVMLHTVTAVLCYYYGVIYPLDLGGQEPLAGDGLPAA